MKIIFITREDLEMPAARIRCLGFADKLKNFGIESEVLSFAEHLGAKSGKEERLMGLMAKLAYNVKAFKRLLREDGVLFLQRFNYHSFAPLAVNLFKGNKMVFDVDDWEAREDIKYYFGRIPSSKAEACMRFTAKKSSLCIGASRFLVDFLSRYNKNVFYIPTAVDTEIFKPTSEPGGGNGSVVLSWLGTMHRPDNVENIKFIIDCFRELTREFSGIKLEITGDGIYRAEVENLVDSLHDKRILLKEWIKPAFIPAYLNSVDIGVMPLTQDTKFNKAKSPTRLFEFMATGKPTVSSSIGEAKYIIQDGKNGFLAASRKEFTAKLKDLIKDVSLRRAIGQEARNTVEEQYSLNLLIGRLLEAFKSL